MKKALKIAAIVVVSLIVLLIGLPFAFKGKIKQTVVAKGNEMLNAEFDFKSLNISLIRNFPKATVTVKDFYIKGVGDFAQDTLASAGRVSATVDVMSLLGDNGYDVSSIFLGDAKIKAVVLEDGRVNWDVMKPDPEDDPQDDTDGESSDFRVKLKKIRIENCDVTYDDRQGKILATIAGLNANCSGDMTASETLLKIDALINKLGVEYEGIAYLKDANVDAQIDVDANLDKMSFVLKENKIRLNNIAAGLDSRFSMPDEGYDMDIKLVTDKIEFKDLLSLIPAVYAKDFKDLQAEGEVRLDAWAKGLMTDSLMPQFNVALDVKNGSFRYPALPKSVEKVNISAIVQNPGGDMDLTVVDVKPLDFTMGGNPFSAIVHLSSPMSDPKFELQAKGIINLGMIKEVYPLEGTELNGVLNANVSVQGRMSYIEKEQYDRVAASGTVGVTNMVVKMDDMPDVNIKKSLLTFSPRYLNLSETAVTIGKSDITADCKLENYIAYALKDKTIKGQLNVRSNFLDLNELMGNSSSSSTSSEASSGTTSFEVPKNVDFDMNTQLKKVLFSNMTLDNVAGQVVVRDGKLDMRNLSFNSLGGNIVANGSYSTAAGAATPALNATFKVNGVSFAESFKTFNTIKQMAPIFEGLKGNFSGSFKMNTTMDKELNPDFKTLFADGMLSTSNLNLSGVEVIDRIADAVKYDKMKNVNIKDLLVNFAVKEGRVHTKPFDIKAADVKMVLGGSTGIDKTIDYAGKITLPKSVGGVANISTLGFKVGGTFSNPKVMVDTKALVEEVVGNVVGDALGKVGQQLGVDLSSVEKQKEALVAEARLAGDKLVAEAQKQVDDLVAKAGGPLEKAAAKIAGDKIMKEARKKADGLVVQATAQGDKLIDKAKAGN